MKHDGRACDSGTSSLHDPAKLRRMVYAVLIAVAAGAGAGRILSVDSVDAIQLEEKRLKEVPTLFDFGGHLF
ncbi:MAG: hypothetical protein D6741_01855, partial [Planctomycetota bacterium]